MSGGGGLPARRGFLFQDHLLIERVLSVVLEQRAATIKGTSAPEPTFHAEIGVTADSPDWDLIERTEKALVVTEVKSGAISAPDRVAMWKRLRRTVVALGSTSKPIVVRLAVDRDATTPSREIWRTLSTKAQTEAATVDPKRVATAEQLAAEALHYLTTRKDDDDANEKVLSLADARAVLSGFEYDDSKSTAEIVAAIDRHLAVLTPEVSVDTLSSTLVGAVVKRAADGNPAQHAFSAMELVQQDLPSLQRLATIRPDALSLWRRLSGLVAPAFVGTPNGGLLAQALEVVQPTAWAALAQNGSRLVLTGHGGLGKSYLLRSVFQRAVAQGQAAIWVSGADLAGQDAPLLAEAIALGVWEKRYARKDLQIFVDAVENVGMLETLRQVVAALHMGGASRVLLTCRATTWAELAGTQEAVPGWTRIPLVEWEPSLVATLAHASQRTGLTADVIRLLRTPFLLDLFLRTFGTDEAIPEGLQTRDGILSAYWRRRVLPSHDPRSVPRATALLSAAEEEARGISGHRTGNPESLAELASEGVFVPSFGAYQFRHALLRDYAVLYWARDQQWDAAGVLARIQSIRPALVRFGALRALVEAVLAPSSEFETSIDRGDVARSFGASIGGMAGDILGELDDPRGVLDLIGRHVLTPAPLLERTIQAAKLSRNIAWIRELNSLPQSTDWIEHSNLVNENFLLRSSELLEVCWRGLPVPEHGAHASCFQQLAHRLRQWSSSPRMAAWLSGREGHWHSIIQEVLLHDPSPDTLLWVRGPATLQFAGMAVLRGLPFTIHKMQAAKQQVDEQVVFEVCAAAAGLEPRDDVLWPRSQHPDYYGLLHSTLMGEEAAKTSVPGLLSSLPLVSLSILTQVMAGLELVEEDERRTREAAFPSAKIDWPFPEPSEELRRLERQLEAQAQPHLSEVETIAPVVDDIPYFGGPGGQFYDDRREIPGLLRSLVDTASAAEVAESVAFFRAVLAGPSAFTQLLALDFLLARSEAKHDALIDAFLISRPLYHCRGSSQTLSKAIRRRWQNMERTNRIRVIANIVSVIRSPIVVGHYACVPFIYALPESDRPALLVPFLELYRLRGLPFEPEPVGHGGERADAADDGPVEVPVPPALFEGLSPEARVAWAGVRALMRQYAQTPSDDALRGAIASLETALATGIPTVGDMSEAHWPVEIAREVLQAAAQHRRTPSGDALVGRLSTLVRCLATWALDILDQQEPPRSGSEPSPAQSFIRDSLWMSALCLVEEILSPPWSPTDAEIRTRFNRHVVDAVRTATPRMAYELFTCIRAYHWRAELGIHEALLQLGRMALGPFALGWFLNRQVWSLPERERQDLIERWLSTPGYFQDDDASRESIGHVGVHVGCFAVARPGEWERRFVQTELNRQSNPTSREGPLPALDDRMMRGVLVSRIAFGAKEFVSGRRWEPTLIDSYTQVLTEAWMAFKDLPEDDGGHFALWAFHSVFDMIRPQASGDAPLWRKWWQALDALASDIVEQGSLRQVHDILFAMRERRIVDGLTPRGVRRIVESVIRRVDREVEQGSPSREHASDGPLSILELACELLQNYACTPETSEAMREQAYVALSRWADLPNSKAISAVQKVRSYQSVR